MRYNQLNYQTGTKYQDKDLTYAYNILLKDKEDVFSKINALYTIARFLDTDPKHFEFLEYLYKKESNTYIKRKIKATIDSELIQQ